MTRTIVRLAALVLAFSLAAAAAQDLAKLYPATLDWQEGAGGRTWECSAEDVWSLKSFDLSFWGELELDLGDATVVFGHHERNVVWAVVLPEEPAELETRGVGDGEEIRSIYLRFHPALVGELFPRKTVRGPGEARHAFEGKRVAQWKMGGSWQAGNRPVIPWKHSQVVDVETAAGRRFWIVDTNEKTLKYEPFFEGKPMRVPQAVTRKEALDAFDQAWEAFDREYPSFVLKPRVRWKSQGKTWRKVAAEATNAYEVACAIGAMLEPLDDLHVWVAAGDDFVPLGQRERPQNASWNGTKALVGGFTEASRDMVWGRTADGLGYVNVFRLMDPNLADAFDAVLEQLADTSGLVVDLRFNGGGDELLARRIAGRFLTDPVVYSRNQYRDGPEHDDFGPVLDRVCEPCGPWTYEAPVVCLWGRRTMSSAESLALMFAYAPGVTTMGDRSAGSSANPRRLELPGGIRVNLPRWRDMTPELVPVEHAGVEPAVLVEAAPAAFTDAADPVLERALETLRATPANERGVGKR